MSAPDKTEKSDAKARLRAKIDALSRHKNADQSKQTPIPVQIEKPPAQTRAQPQAHTQISQDPIRIILFMIVKNESKIIRRCLLSTRGIVDAICISDTGSTDNNVEIMKNTIAEMKIPGVVINEPWIDFGKSRTMSYLEAKKMAISLGWDLERTYGLTIDADMETKLKTTLEEFTKSKQEMVADKYDLEQFNRGLRYFNARLMKFAHDFRSVGVTHEYWSAYTPKPDGKPWEGEGKNITSEKMNTIWLDDHDDGGCKADKFERDIRLLTQGLIDEPKNERYMFYLAQSYKSLGRWDESIERYKIRITAGGYAEEVWYSHLMIAECYREKSKAAKEKWLKAEKDMNEIPDDYGSLREEAAYIEDFAPADGPIGSNERQAHLNRKTTSEPSPKDNLAALVKKHKEEEEINWALALSWYLKAYQNRSTRAESLYELAKYYRETSAQELGFLFANLCNNIPYPEGDGLFISTDVYEHCPLQEMAICGFYTKRNRMDGFNACEELLFDPDVKWKVKSDIHMNEYYYTPKLAYDWFRNIDIQRPFIREDGEVNPDFKDDSQYRGLNPSFCRDPASKGYTMIFRTVNFTHDNEHSSYTSMHKDGKIRTRNFLVKMDSFLQVKSQVEIIDPDAGSASRYDAQVLGLEDCRIFANGTRLWFTCTTCDTRENKVPQITLCRIGKSITDDGKLPVDLFLPLKGVKDMKNKTNVECEKNWLPFMNGSDINIIYGYQPFTIIKPVLNDTKEYKRGDTEEVLSIKIDLDLSRFRGGSSPVPFDDGHIFVIHEVIFEKKKHNDKEWFRRHYVHRFVYLDKKYELKKISLPFFFEKPETEFCSGLALDYAGHQLMMACGINDEKVTVYGIGEEKVKKMLKTIVAN